MIAILGGGISGLSASYHLNQAGRENQAYERRSSAGGLLDNFVVSGYLFDYFVHLSFTENQYVRDLFADSTKYIVHHPDPWCWYNDRWLKHPIQNNLYPLPAEDRVRYIESFLAAKGRKPRDYREWLYRSLGEEFANDFSLPYTQKYWKTAAENLATSWVGSRVYRPSLNEVLFGAMTGETPLTYYAKEMRYPVRGGYRQFIAKIVDRAAVALDHDVAAIDLKAKTVEFRSGAQVHYETLVNTLPLPTVVRLIKDCPPSVIRAAEDLSWTSGTLVSLGFRTPDAVPPYLWFYIYDADMLSARAYSPSQKSPNNVPVGASSIQFEIYSSVEQPLTMGLDAVLNHTIEKAAQKGLIRLNDLVVQDVRHVEFANVAITKKTARARGEIQRWLASRGVIGAGRFGEWAYLWSDQSLLSGKKAADKIIG